MMTVMSLLTRLDLLGSELSSSVKEMNGKVVGEWKGNVRHTGAVPVHQLLLRTHTAAGFMMAAVACHRTQAHIYSETTAH